MDKKEETKPQKKNDTTKPKRVRSPNFPVLALNDAIELSKKLYEKYTRASVPIPIAMAYLGYPAKSGPTLQKIATLSAYGLIATEGTGENKRIRISDLAFTIIKDPDLNKREQSIKTAAMRPAIFMKILKKYSGQIPEQAIFEFDLEKEGEFNLKSIRDFIDIFTKTVTLAKISESDIINKDGEKPNGQNYEEFGDKIMDNTSVKSSDVPGTRFQQPKTASLRPSDAVSDREREIANYPAGPGITIRIMASGEGAITQKSIDKLIKHLELDKEYFPEDEAKEN